MSELPEAPPAIKIWWQSKTVWINMLALLAMIVQSQFGYVLSVETQGALLVVINLALRAVTGSAISWSAADKEGGTHAQP